MGHKDALSLCPINISEATECPHLTKHASRQGRVPASQQNLSRPVRTSQSPKSRLNLYRVKTLGTLVSPMGEGTQKNLGSTES